MLLVATALGVILLNQGARWYLTANTTNLGYRMVDAKWTLLDDLEQPADWLILGDSSGAHGIVPEVWNEVLEGRAVNLAILANLIVVNDAWMLDEYIERFGPPKHVVLVHAFDVWKRKMNTALLGKIPRAWGYWSRSEPPVELDAEKMRKVFLSRYLPLYAESTTLKEHLEELGPPRDVNFEMTEDGFIPGRPHSATRLRKDLKRTKKFLRNNKKFVLSKQNRSALERIGALADKHGFNVFVVNGPQSESIARMTEFKNYRAQSEKTLSKVANKYANLHLVPDLLTYKFAQLEAYADHVTPEMAPTHTRDTAERVRSFMKKRGLFDRPVVRSADALQAKKIVRAEGKERVSLLFGGDTMFARDISTLIENRGGDAAAVLKRIAPVVQSADLAFLNLECVLSDSGAQEAKKRWRIRARSDYASALRDIGVDLVSLANNHILDFGQQGLESTLATVLEHDVQHVGVVWDADMNQDPTVAEVGGQTFGFLGYTDVEKWKVPKGGLANVKWPKPANFSMERILSDIRRAKRAVDHVVVSVHWGHEYSMVASEEMQTRARAFIDAGAELVIGHHPHVPAPVERYKGGLIAYSLGNFMFDKKAIFKRTRNWRRFMLRVEYDAGGLADFELVPILSDLTYGPWVEDKIPVDSFIVPSPAPAFDFADELSSATVERHVGDQVRKCAEWTTKRPRSRKMGYLKWMKPRWKCPGDEREPWLTVARDADRSADEYRRFVWAHPHPSGPLKIRLDDVLLGDQLLGFGGIPDWPLKLAKREKAPMDITVRIAGGPTHTQSVPFEAGWKDFAVDTTSLAGRRANIEVEVSGGPRGETGFGFNLLVPASASPPR